MIKILRAGIPLCLNKPDNEFVEGDCTKPEVKDALLAMQHGKCCYCERDLYELGSAGKDVEHYIPKHACKDGEGNIQWHVANRWDNLLYACKTCNAKKGKEHPINRTGQLQIIDPTNEGIDPEDHIDFRINYPIITYSEKAGSSLGRSTIRKLKFNERSELGSKFRKMILRIDEQVYDLVDAITNNNTEKINSVKDDLEKATSAYLPHAAFARKYISNRIKDINAKKDYFEGSSGVPFQEIEINICKGYETAM